MSSVMRVPDEVRDEAQRLAAMQGKQPGEVIASAWREYIERHREEFAAGLEQAARLLRDGTLEEFAAFASRRS